MAAEEVADVSDRRAQRTGVTYGNMRPKLSDYIGQVFECKADSPHYSRRVLVKWRGGARQARRARLAERVDLVDLVYFVHLVGLVQPNKPSRPNK